MRCATRMCARSLLNLDANSSLSTLPYCLWRAAHELISTLLYQKANSAAAPSGIVEGATNWVEKLGF
jgi:hypothetical protein